MEWMWAAFSAIWTLAAWFVARASWLMARHWSEAGIVSNGMGMELGRESNPFAFRLACYGTRFIAIWALLFVLIGVAVTIGWIVKAI